MKIIDHIYINGQFVKPHGTEYFELINPTNRQVIGKVRLGNEQDVQDAVAAAKFAFKTFSQTTIQERGEYLTRLHKVVSARIPELVALAIEEYGAPISRAEWMATYAASSFLNAKKVMEAFAFKRQAGISTVMMEPVGVAGMITPWNANYGFICNKLAYAIAAGCTTVIKPSEMSGLQTQLILECLHEAGLPAGVLNVVNGRGDVAGEAITAHPDVAKISFTGSTIVGKKIAKGAIDTLKRVTLELGGKSPNIILDDADFAQVAKISIAAAYMNNSQACIAGTRLLVPEHKLEEIKKFIKLEVETNVVVGDPKDKRTTLGPLVSQKQFDRVQNYIKIGLAEGAELLTGGLGQPQGLEAGNFVKPTVFFNVTNQMTIAREEIFGPVLSIIAYKTEEEAVEIANDSVYGLQAYVNSGSHERATKIAHRLQAGRVQVNGLHDEPLAPFGGFKQSGIGREFGSFGLEAYLEPKAILG